MKEAQQEDKRRFVVRLGGSIDRGFYGENFFCYHDSYYTQKGKPDVRPLDELIQLPLSVVLAPPGYGIDRALNDSICRANSTETQKILNFSCQPTPNTLALEEFIFKTSSWGSWSKNQTHITLVIQNLETLLCKEPNAIKYICERLSLFPISRLRLIISCNIGFWSFEDGRKLHHLFTEKHEGFHQDDVSVYELCPLRSTDALRIAGEQGVENIDLFIKEIETKNLLSYASHPVILESLIRRCIDKTIIKISKKELLQDFALNLCKSAIIKHRFLDLTSSQLLFVTCRIAAILKLSGKNTIQVDCHFSDIENALAIGDLEGIENYNGSDLIITINTVRVALDTGIFSLKGSSLYGFEFQILGDVLAGLYLCKLKPPALKRLFFDSSQPTLNIHPDFMGVAAWAATDNDDFLEEIMASEPEILVQADFSHKGNETKSQIVAAALKRAEFGHHFDFFSSVTEYSGLDHPSLSEQLSAVIANSKLNKVARRIAVEIAADNHCHGLLPDFIKVIKNPKDKELDEVLARNLKSLAQEKDISKIFELLKQTDYDVAVKKGIFRSLLKLKVPMRKLAPYLDEVLKGGDSFDYMVTDYVEVDDVETLLKEFCAPDKWGDVFDILNPGQHLIDRCLQIAIENIDYKRSFVRLISGLLIKGARHYSLQRESSHRSLSILKEDRKLSRRICKFLLNLSSMNPTIVWRITQDAILDEEDFIWIFDEYKKAKSQFKPNWAEALHCFRFSNQIEECWDKLHYRILNDEVLGERFDSWKKYESYQQLVEERKREREDYLKEQEQYNKKEAHPPVRKIILRNFSEIEEHGIHVWRTLSHNLYFEEDGKRNEEAKSYDLEATPGWIKCSDTQKSLLIKYAERFLIETKKVVLKKGLYYSSDFINAVYRATWLLRDSILRKSTLKLAISEKWIPVLTSYIHNGDEHHQHLIKILYRVNPSKVLDRIKKEIISDAGRGSGWTNDPKSLEFCWNSSISKLVDRLIIQRDFPPETNSCLMDIYAVCDLDNASKTWSKLHKALLKQPRSIKLRKRFVSVSASLFPKASIQNRTKILDSLEDQAPLAKSFLLKLSYSLGWKDKERENIEKDLLPSQLADLFLLANRFFPPSSDPELVSGKANTVTSRVEVGRFRDNILTWLSNIGTEKAVNELERITNKVPKKQKVWIQWRRKEAELKMRKFLFKTKNPAEIIKSLEEQNYDRITSNEELFHMVNDALSKLQNHLQKNQDSTVRNYWLFEKTDKKGDAVPEHEDQCSFQIATWLKTYFEKLNVDVQREKHIQWENRTDIEISTWIKERRNWKRCNVIIEVKGIWHKNVNNALRTQLVEDYMIRSSAQFGIYLVLWPICSKYKKANNLKENSLDDARSKVLKMSEPYHGKAGQPKVSSFVLDISLFDRNS